MANQVIPLFKTNYVDYLGRLRYLEVKSVTGRGGSASGRGGSASGRGGTVAGRVDSVAGYGGSVSGGGGAFYFHCIIDEQDAFDLRLGEDGQWYDLREGPTVLADEIGSVIESRIV